MSRSTADPAASHEPGASSGGCVLRLDAGAWILTTPDGVHRQELDGAPALQLERFERAAAPPRAPLHVVIGDGWLRYLVLRWPAPVRSREERRAYLAHRFREVHGVAAPEWTLAADGDTVSFPLLACAVPAALIGAVRAFADQRRLRLAAVTGDFVASFNAWQPSFREPAGCFGALALARSGRMTVGLWRDGAWQALRSQPLGDDGAAAVRHMLEGWCLTAGQTAEAGTASAGVLYACGLDAAAPAGWRVEWRGRGPWG